MRGQSVLSRAGVEPGPKKGAEAGDSQEGPNDTPPEPKVRVADDPVLCRAREGQPGEDRVEHADENPDGSFHCGVIYWPE